MPGTLADALLAAPVRAVYFPCSFSETFNRFRERYTVLAAVHMLIPGHLYDQPKGSYHMTCDGSLLCTAAGSAGHEQVQAGLMSCLAHWLMHCLQHQARRYDL